MVVLVAPSSCCYVWDTTFTGCADGLEQRRRGGTGGNDGGVWRQRGDSDVLC